MNLQSPAVRKAGILALLAMLIFGVWLLAGRDDSDLIGTSLYGFNRDSGGEVVLVIDGIPIRERDWELAVLKTTTANEYMIANPGEGELAAMQQRILQLQARYGSDTVAMAGLVIDASLMREAKRLGVGASQAEIDEAVQQLHDVIEGIREGQTSASPEALTPMEIMRDRVGETEYWDVVVPGLQRIGVVQGKLFNQIARIDNRSAEQAAQAWLAYRFTAAAASKMAIPESGHPASQVSPREVVAYLQESTTIAP